MIFFVEACLDATPTFIENVDPKAAVIYQIIVRDRLEVIVSLPRDNLCVVILRPYLKPK